MSNSHPVVLLRQKVDLEEDELDAVVSRVTILEDACTSNLENSNVSQITLLKGRAGALESTRATIIALNGVKATADKAESDVSALELDKVDVNTTAIGANESAISENKSAIALKASQDALDTQTGRINGHDTSFNALSLELDTKATKVALTDLSSNFHATKTEYGHTKETVASHQRSINSMQQQIDTDTNKLAEEYYNIEQIDATNTANTSRFNALDISVNLLRTDLTAAENKGGNNGILIHKNIQDISGLSGTVNENEQKQIDGDEVLKLRIDGHDASLNLLRQHVDEWDVLSKTEKANLAEVFQNMHKNWFAARSVATQNLQKDTDNELALAGIISGAHEKFTINGNKFSVSQSGYYSISADITSVFAGEV
jgi:hypothetical protein